MNSAAHILVVDDDTSGRRLTRATLTKAGFKVTEAGNGEEALAKLAEGLPDLVLMDVSMPVMDGFAACVELKRLPGGARVPVVMMTGLDDVGSIERAFEAGASDFITKPINWTILAYRVRYMLRASRAIDQLARHEKRLSNAQRIGEMGDWEWDVRAGRIVPSEQARRILGQPTDMGELDVEILLATVHTDDAQALRDACEKAIESGTPFAIDHRIVHRDGSVHHVHQQVEVTERDATGRATQLAGAVNDITRHKDAEEQIRRLAYYDALTGLPNRRLFTEQLQKALARAERFGQRAAIMFVDLDHFKRVNDTLGHNAGDELLREVSSRLAGSLRGYDAVSRGEGDGAGSGVHSLARLGGDEFIVMLTDLRAPADAGTVARRLVETVSQAVTVQGTEIFVGASIGIALYPDDGKDIETLLKNADTAMYRAKSAGRGAFQYYDASMNARALDQLMMEARLRHALERREFVLHYQPKVDIESGRIVGAEALIRWQHPERGLVPPGEFIPLMEQTGLIIPAGEWAIDTACKQAAAWRAAGLGTVPVSVNLAATHLSERSLPELVARSLAAYDVPASCLEIEVTESILMADSPLTLEIAHKLSEMGVALLIDDFGTGYSSMSYLKRLPITALKIDRSFVRDLQADSDDEAIVSAIVALGHSLNLRVVAEGVETAAQLAFLKSRHCDQYQGFLTSPAVEAERFAHLLRGN